MPKPVDNVSKLHDMVQALEDRAHRIDTGIRIFALGNRVFAENMERFKFHPDVDRLNKMIADINEYLMMHRDDELVASMHERYE